MLMASPLLAPWLPYGYGRPQLLGWIERGSQMAENFDVAAARLARRRLATVAVCIALAASWVGMGSVGTASAESRADHTVDPSTLIPPPPAEFNPVCKAVGERTICDISFTDPPVVAEPSGVQCGSGAGSFEPLVSFTRSVDGKRYYDQNRQLTERHFHDIIVGTYTNPLTGASVPFRQHDTVMHRLVVPGDFSTGTEAITVEIRIAEPDGGTVLIDAGRTVVAESDGTILFEAGQHPFDEYFVFGDTSALQPLCDALD
jgi:hypothetical protein